MKNKANNEQLSNYDIFFAQVDKSHYSFNDYMTKKRWISMWHQLDEVLSLAPKKVLEIGPGPGVFKSLADLFGIKVETLDLDPDLVPDYVASADKMPFENGDYDVVCAFQMLEHVAYDTTLAIFREMTRVAREYVVISLPDARPVWPYSLYVPKKGEVKFLIPRPWKGPKTHQFDGEHYWEINKKGYTLEKVKNDLERVSNVKLLRTYRVVENPYHRFFIFTTNQS